MNPDLRIAGRRDRRNATGLPVKIRRMDQEWSRALALEITERGARLRTSAEIKSGELLEISPIYSSNVAARANCVWVRRIPETQEAECGVEFASPISLETLFVSAPGDIPIT